MPTLAQNKDNFLLVHQQSLYSIHKASHYYEETKLHHSCSGIVYFAPLIDTLFVGTDINDRRDAKIVLYRGATKCQCGEINLHDLRHNQPRFSVCNKAVCAWGTTGNDIIFFPFPFRVCLKIEDVPFRSHYHLRVALSDSGFIIMVHGDHLMRLHVEQQLYVSILRFPSKEERSWTQLHVLTIPMERGMLAHQLLCSTTNIVYGLLEKYWNYQKERAIMLLLDLTTHSVSYEELETNHPLVTQRSGSFLLAENSFIAVQPNKDKPGTPFCAIFSL